MRWKTRRIVGIVMIAIAGIGIKVALVYNSLEAAIGAILLLIFGLEVWREITIDTILKVEAEPEDMPKWQELAKKYPNSGIEVIAYQNLGSLIKGWNVIKKQESKKGLWANWVDYHWVSKKPIGEKVDLADEGDPTNAMREVVKGFNPSLRSKLDSRITDAGLAEISAKDLAELKAKAAQKMVDQAVGDGEIDSYINNEIERQLKNSVAGKHNYISEPEIDTMELFGLVSDHYNSKDPIWRAAIVVHSTPEPCANCQTETLLYATDYEKPICSKYCDTTYVIEQLREDE